MTADVISLPIPQRSCVVCVNAVVGPRGTYCMTFDEVILAEKSVAAECGEYEPDEEAQQ